MLSFQTTHEEVTLIYAIARRGTAIERQMDIGVDVFRGAMDADVFGAAMDIAAVHANGCPLRLADFLGAGDADFIHDYVGIRRHLNRETGQLENCFVPRFAVK